MENNIVIDVYRFCTTVYDILKAGADKCYVTNDRFLPRRIKENQKWKDLITFGESKGIKLPWTDYDNSPLEVPENLIGRRCMVRSSMGARRVEQSMKKQYTTWLACIRNYSCYIDMKASSVYITYDDIHDKYCKDLIIKELIRDCNIGYEKHLCSIAKDIATAECCYKVEEKPFAIKIIREKQTNLLEAIKA